MKKFLFLLLILSFFACSNSNDNNSGPDASTNLNGAWIIHMGIDYPVTIVTSSTTLNYNQVSFTGTYSGDSFTGQNHETYNQSIYDITFFIRMINKDSVAGYNRTIIHQFKPIDFR